MNKIIDEVHGWGSRLISRELTKPHLATQYVATVRSAAVLYEDIAESLSVKLGWVQDEEQVQATLDIAAGLLESVRLKRPDDERSAARIAAVAA